MADWNSDLKSCPFREPDTSFSQVHTFQACLLRTFPCLSLVRGLSLQEHATDAGPPVQEECSRGGRKEHGSHLVGGRAKAAAISYRSEQRVPFLEHRFGVGCEYLRGSGCYMKRLYHFLAPS